jgi:hypothetical protein
MFKATKSAVTYRGYKHDSAWFRKPCEKHLGSASPSTSPPRIPAFNAMRLMLRAGKNRQMYASAFHPLSREDRNAYLCC